MKTSLSFLLGILISFSAFAQKEATNWFFGYKLGMNFSSGYPVQLLGNTTITSAYNGCSIISDKNGDLLFYSDGYNVYNRNHHIMPNGSATIIGFGPTENFTLIVPKPGSSNLFYLFIADNAPNNTMGLRYCVIDMDQNGGMGDVVLKNQPLIPKVYNRVAAIKHKNGQDYWLISHEWNSNAFYAYLISSSGLSAPVITNIGDVYSGDLYHGQFKISPDGKKLALALTDFVTIHTTDIYDFNNQSGKITNPVHLANLLTQPRGIEFSPDSKKLYISHENPFNHNQGLPMMISQVDISSGITTIIKNSITKISPCPKYDIQSLQLGPDGKIYVAGNNKFYGVIHDPNESGSASYYQDSIKVLNNAQSLNANLYGALPNFISSYFQPKFVYNFTCIEDSTVFNIADTTNVIAVDWNFGDSASGASNISNDFAPKHKSSSHGDFNVKMTLLWKDGTSEYYYHNVYIKRPLSPFDLGKDTLLCGGQTLHLNPCFQGVSYLWQDNSSNPYYEVTSSDTIWLEISNACGSVRDSIIVNFQEPPEVDLGKDTTLCYDLFPVNLNVVVTGATYKWSDGSLNSTFQVPFADTYWVDVTKGVCTVRDSITFISTSPAPIVHLGKDTALCDNDTLLLNSFNQGANYLWQDHSILPDYYVTKADTVSVKVTLGACIREDTIIVNFKTLPVLHLGNDTTICKGDILTLNAFHPGYSYLWKDGSTQSYFTVSQNDTAWAEVTLNDCKSSDSIIVNYISPPSIDLGKDTILCQGEFLDLRVNADSASYLWSNGSSLSEQHITTSDTIGLKATNKCGEDEDSIIVSFITPPVILLGNDTILCYHDSLLIKLPNNYEYTWNDSNKGNNYLITSSGVYTVEAKNKCGTATATKKIENVSCCNPSVPNLLTSNRDGLNETLIISCIEDGSWKLNIFNRWGENIYSTNDYRNDFNASSLDEGVYFYSLSKAGRKEIKGWIQVVK